MKRILFLTVVACTLTSTAALQAKLPDEEKIANTSRRISEQFYLRHSHEITKFFVDTWSRQKRHNTAKFVVERADDVIVIKRVPNHEKQSQMDARMVTINGINKVICELHKQIEQNGTHFFDHLESSSVKPNELHIKSVFIPDPFSQEEDSEDEIADLVGELSEEEDNANNQIADENAAN